MRDEGDFGLVPAQPEEGEGRNLIVDQVLRDLQDQHDQGHSYFEMIPPEHQQYVRDKLAKNNFPDFKDQFNDNFEDFLEAVSKNWLAKFNAFGTLAKQSGFTSSSEAIKDKPIVGQLNQLSWAILTKSASYVLVGPGAIRVGDSNGAQVIYSRIPLRDQAQNEVAENSFFNRGIPIIGKSLFMENGPFVSTSPVVEIYNRLIDEAQPVKPEELEDLDRSLIQSFLDIDHKTIF